ncbi:hypothetical protein [Streptomyces acidiscabies]|uniref:hypothetical protein n=1 Tax=Streptomyces acidiscabies TaxID=42234 RepID=UPI0038F64F26
MISHHRAFIARRGTERPSEEYRELTTTGWNEFLAHFALREVAPGTCGHDYATPCQQEIHANLVDRLQEARDQGRRGEVAAIKTTMAAAAQKLSRPRH